MTVKVAAQNRLAAYAAARRRAVDFLVAHMNADGSVGPFEEFVFYYRVPWALALAGETSAAMRSLEWIARHMLDSEGALRGSASPDAGRGRTTNTYPETIFAFGAHLLRRFDLAQRAMRWAFRSQDPETGGVFLDGERTGPDDPQLLFLTAQLGMSALLTGHMAAAEAAGRWMEWMWRAQPELPARLFTVRSRTGGLVTQIPPEADRRLYVNNSQAEHEYHYNGGIAAAFLAQLYLRTSDTGWLDLAQRYQRFSMDSTPDQFQTRQVCKSAWGAGLLAIITGAPEYRDWTARLGDWFVEVQEDDGSYVNSQYLNPNPTLGERIEITAEFTVHLDTVLAALGMKQ
jgi:hypothetical protein